MQWMSDMSFETIYLPQDHAHASWRQAVQVRLLRLPLKHQRQLQASLQGCPQRFVVHCKAVHKRLLFTARLSTKVRCSLLGCPQRFVYQLSMFFYVVIFHTGFPVKWVKVCDIYPDEHNKEVIVSSSAKTELKQNWIAAQKNFWVAFLLFSCT